LALAAFSGDLASFATESASPVARDRLVTAVVRLCRLARHTTLPAETADQVSGLTHNLLDFSDPETHLRLAEDLATSPWPNQKLIWALATGPVESAAPILRLSPVLDQMDLAALIRATGPEHHVEIARRPHLSVAVIDLLLAARDPAVLTAVAENSGLTLSIHQLEMLTMAARNVAALRKPLACHAGLSESQAYGLYAWCDPSLRQALAARFDLKTRCLDAALADTEPTQAIDETATAAFITKVAGAGQLTTSFLIRALMEDRLSIFLQGLAHLGQLSLPGLRAALDAPSAEPLALACRAVGMDRTVFPQVLATVRRLNDNRPHQHPDDSDRVDQAFSGVSPPWAARAFAMLTQKRI